jgi:hypothetical protein
VLTSCAFIISRLGKSTSFHRHTVYVQQDFGVLACSMSVYALMCECGKCAAYVWHATGKYCIRYNCSVHKTGLWHVYVMFGVCVQGVCRGGMCMKCEVVCMCPAWFACGAHGVCLWHSCMRCAGGMCVACAQCKCHVFTACIQCVYGMHVGVASMHEACLQFACLMCLAACIHVFGMCAVPMRHVYCVFALVHTHNLNCT